MQAQGQLQEAAPSLCTVMDGFMRGYWHVFQEELLDLGVSCTGNTGPSLGEN